jgi:hypothetical protein
MKDAIEIIVLSPGWFFTGSHARGQEARLYLSWLWKRPVTIRAIDCYCSIMLRPLEWLFPLARVGGRWVPLASGIKPAGLRSRLGLPPLEEAVCLVVGPGRPIFGLNARGHLELAVPTTEVLVVPDGLAAATLVDPCGLPWPFAARSKELPSNCSVR